MCHENDATPAVFTEPLTDAIGRSLTLTSADGTAFRAHAVTPERSAVGSGVVVLPDVRGLHPFYERLAVRFAEQGHAAVAIDYFGRTAGTGLRGDDFPVREHITQVRRDRIDEDIEAAIAFLRSPDGGSCTSAFAVGFCFGGRQAFFASRPRFRLGGVAGFYGGPGLFPNGALGPTQRAAELDAPILGLFGGADEGIPEVDVLAFDRALSEAGVEHEIVTYPGMPHGFFEAARPEFGDASRDAWRRVLELIARRAGNPALDLEA
jgi:carboxymethylenebutenolidase